MRKKPLIPIVHAEFVLFLLSLIHINVALKNFGEFCQKPESTTIKIKVN